MKIKYFQVILVGLMAIPFLSFLFIAVPASHAQSSQIWSDPINLSKAGSSIDPTLVIDAAGTIHVVWVDLFDGHKYVKSTDGINWTSPITVRFPFAPDDSLPVFLADESGGIHALWQNKFNALYYAKMAPGNDLASSWSNRTKLADSVIDFTAVVSSLDILHIGYVSSFATDSQPSGIYYRQLKGTSWSNAINLYSSQYFRSSNPEEANVHLAVREENELETVYMVWDDRPQKRILLSKSLDGGNVWESAIQIRGSEGGSGTPYNVNVGAVDGKVLLLWQSGLLGSQCTLYSQWSTDGAENFGSPVKMLDELAGCPQTSEFIMVKKDTSVVSLNIFNDISLMAWNGSFWSEQRTQNEITTFINPATFDSVIFGCQKLSVYDEQLVVVGCDKGSSGDIWFSSRLLGTDKDWFPPSSVWTDPVEVTIVNKQISALSSVSDDENNIHTFWVQPPLVGGREGTAVIQYARWDGKSWSNPTAVISGLSGNPIQLTVNADHLGRLLLAWIDGKTGEVLFSRASADLASRSLEWEKPLSLSTASQANSSPDILVDTSGRIVIVYAVPINEKRGIYLVESGDAGKTWSHPLQVFDAVSASGDIVDQAKIGLTGDGRLHVLFSKFSLQGEQRQSLGLYYSQSTDGGLTWSEPEEITNKPVHWSEIVGYDRSILHRLWQEYRQSMLVSFHQISQDGGATWNNPVIVSSISANTSLTTQIMDRTGNLHCLQLTTENNLIILNHHMWDGSRWVSQKPKELYIQDRGVLSSITAGVSSKGNLLVSALADYPYLTDELKSGILSVGKSLGLPEEIQTPYPAIIAVAEPTVVVSEDISNILQTPTQTSALSGLTSSLSSLLNKNLVGFLLLSGIIVLIIVIFRPNARKKK